MNYPDCPKHGELLWFISRDDETGCTTWECDYCKRREVYCDFDPEPEWTDDDAPEIAAEEIDP